MWASFHVIKTLFDFETIRIWKNRTHFNGNIITTKQSLNYKKRWHKSTDTETALAIYMPQFRNREAFVLYNTILIRYTMIVLTCDNS
jgi:hypothetical protein